ncbi:Sarcalumenin [Harpegnathos saltator]|uniref:Sarcalumenin n=1 Tax=Harpegnathos saltator TaxID=610380 RepID=E2B2S3_HARSA|nr:Sarcalumenin [Harpegnathos saltator]
MTIARMRSALVAGLLLSLLAVALQGVLCEEEPEQIPPEDLCRPYIEKALKNLGSLEQTSAEVEVEVVDRESHEETEAASEEAPADEASANDASEEVGEVVKDEEESAEDDVEKTASESKEATEEQVETSEEIVKDKSGRDEDEQESDEVRTIERETEEATDASAEITVEKHADSVPEKVTESDEGSEQTTANEKDEKSDEENSDEEEAKIVEDEKSEEEKVYEAKSEVEEEEAAEKPKSEEEEHEEKEESREISEQAVVESEEEDKIESEIQRTSAEVSDEEEEVEEGAAESTAEDREQMSGESAEEEAVSKTEEKESEEETIEVTSPESTEEGTKLTEEEEETKEAGTISAEEEKDGKSAVDETKSAEEEEEEREEEEEEEEEVRKKSEEEGTRCEDNAECEQSVEQEDREKSEAKSAEEEEEDARKEKEKTEEKSEEEEGGRGRKSDEEEDQDVKSRGRREVGDEEDAEATGESTEEAVSEEEQEFTPEEDLIRDIEIPENLRPRDHINQLLKLDEENEEKERAVQRVADIILRELKRLYDNAIQPLEAMYRYRDLSNRHFGDPEIFSKPLVLFMGPWSGGKSSIINYLLDIEYKPMSLRTEKHYGTSAMEMTMVGAEPSPAYFNIIMHGEEEEILDGTQLAADWTFSGLQKFGQGMLDRLRGLRLDNKLLEKVNIVEIPGILEIRKQVQRLFPFNDACQWFIDRADIIFLVYDPAKLDVGPETEAILDQLKGREYQTRIILNKADQVKPEELMRVQGALIWNISPLMSSAEPPIMYSASLWSLPYEAGAPTRLLYAQERAFLRDLRSAINKRVEHKIASARRFAVRVRNHAKMVDCYLTTYYNHKTFFGDKRQISDKIIENPQDYHIYEGLSTLTNISRYDLPDPDVYRDFFRLNPLYDFPLLSSTCTYFRGCPINRLDVAIAYDLPELVGKYKKSVEAVLHESEVNSPAS